MHLSSIEWLPQWLSAFYLPLNHFYSKANQKNHVAHEKDSTFVKKYYKECQK